MNQMAMFFMKKAPFYPSAPVENHRYTFWSRVLETTSRRFCCLFGLIFGILKHVGSESSNSSMRTSIGLLSMLDNCVTYLGLMWFL